MYWIEYVTRHGKNALRSPSTDLDWWQAENVDVYAAIATSIFITVGIVMYLAYKIFSSMLFWKKFRSIEYECSDRKLK